MIYKFKDHVQGTELEIEQHNIDAVSFEITIDEKFLSVSLCKKDIYHLIGALHLLHKEME